MLVPWHPLGMSVEQRTAGSKGICQPLRLPPSASAQFSALCVKYPKFCGSWRKNWGCSIAMGWEQLEEKAWIASCLWQLFFFLNMVFCHLPSILYCIADCCLLLYSAFRIFATSKWLIKKICLCRKWSVKLSTVSITWVLVIFFP